MISPRVMVSTPDDYGGHQRETQGLSEIKQAQRAQSRPGSGVGGPRSRVGGLGSGGPVVPGVRAAGLEVGAQRAPRLLVSHILCFSPQLIFLSLPFLFISPRNDHALFDNSSFGKLIVEGPEAAEALDWICRY